MESFGSYHRKAFLQIKPHLVAKTTDGSRTGSVGLGNPILHNMPE